MLKLAEIYNNYGILPNLPLAAGRITMINGFRDMTMYGNYVHDRKEQLKGWVKSFYGDSSLGIAEITYAEVCYQRDECFEAITTLVGIIPFIEKRRRNCCFVYCFEPSDADYDSNRTDSGGISDSGRDISEAS